MSDADDFVLKMPVGGTIGRLMREGKGRLIAVIVYSFEDDCLKFGYPEGVEKDEAKAVLSKYGVPVKRLVPDNGEANGAQKER